MGVAVSRGVNPILTAIPGLTGTYAWPQITVNAGGQITAIASLTTFTGNLTVTGTLTAAALAITGSATFAGPSTFSGTSTFNGLKVTGTAALGPSISGLGAVAGAQVDMTPDGGTFTLSHTGFTTAVTSTAAWYRIGNIVILNTGTVTGTSNATTWTATGLPAAIQPSRAQTITIGDASDAGTGVAAVVTMFAAGAGTLQFGKGFFEGAVWTATGAKGFGNSGGTTFAYLLS